MNATHSRFTTSLLDLIMIKQPSATLISGPMLIKVIMISVKPFYSGGCSLCVAVELRCFLLTGVSVYYLFHLIYINEGRLNNRITLLYIAVQLRETKS